VFGDLNSFANQPRNYIVKARGKDVRALQLFSSPISIYTIHTISFLP